MNSLGVSRRQFLRTGATMAAASAIVPPGSFAEWNAARSDRASEEMLGKALALRAVDAAKSAGAHYADVRVTRNVSLTCQDGLNLKEEQALTVGVRALVQGYWGFASGPYWTLEEMSRLANEAVAQARLNARGKARTVDLGIRPVASGTWTTPMAIDPFSVPYEEVMDFCRAFDAEVRQYNDTILGRATIGLTRTEKTCATTDGALFSQRLVSVAGDFHIVLIGLTDQKISLQQTGAGWEYIQEADVYTQIPELIERARQMKSIALYPVDVGRYDIVFDAESMASLTAETIGPATQLDRALGYEANAGGTSFLNAPLEMLGTKALASPLVTVTADRTLPRGIATVQWDDEGVSPVAFPVIRDGVLVDYQTTREQAAWLEPYYSQTGQPVQSRGCASVASALDLPTQHTPNLILEPGSDDIGFEELVAGVSNGLAMQGMTMQTDFQVRQGSSIMGRVRQIVNGKLGPIVTGAGLLFTTEEMWKNIQQLGGPRSVVKNAFASRKGEPAQSCPFTASAVPALIKDIAVIDRQRKA